MSQGKTKEESLENIDKAIKAYMEVLEKEPSGEVATRKVEVTIP
jgi:predicted RNase H-like HicB family nuclease